MAPERLQIKQELFKIMDLKHCFCNLKDDLFNCFLLAKFSAMISLKVVDIICQIGIGIGFCHSDSLSSSCKSQWSVITNQWPNPSEWVSCVLTVQSFHTTLGDWLANPTTHLFMKLLKHKEFRTRKNARYKNTENTLTNCKGQKIQRRK